jgi:adenylyltransferase/sulfurtransferase
MGVFAPLVGIIGAMQASEALRCSRRRQLAGRPPADARRPHDGVDEMRVPRDPACPVCAERRG